MKIKTADALTHLEALHGGLEGPEDGWAAWCGKPTKGRFWTRWTRPGALPDLDRLPRWSDLYVSVCTFSGNTRTKADALVVPACWIDLDPPKGLDLHLLDPWRKAAHLKLVAEPIPTFTAFSGRGLYGFWKLDPPVRLDGEDGPALRDRVEAVNRALAFRLGGGSWRYGRRPYPARARDREPETRSPWCPVPRGLVGRPDLRPGRARASRRGQSAHPKKGVFGCPEGGRGFCGPKKRALTPTFKAKIR